MAGRFPHLTQATPFPTSNVNVYGTYQNNFDYSRYLDNVHIKVCRVPWGADYADVVKFADDTARDAYLDGLAGYEFDTKFNLLPATTLKVPIPATNMQTYNYLYLDLPIMTSDMYPLDYADGDRVGRLCYFIDEVRQGASNSTECSLRLDVWTTYINHITFSYAMLARGHAPLAATDINAYLANPAANNKYLLAADVSIGAELPAYTRDSVTVDFTSGDMWLVFVTDADPTAAWGNLDELTATTPAPWVSVVQSAIAPGAWALSLDDMEGFFGAVATGCPQFLATVKCVFVVERDLVSTAETITFLGYDFRRLTAQQQVRDLIDPATAEFGYAPEYKNLAKLYTYPYAALRIYTEDGTEQLVRIENLTGPLRMRLMVSLVYPYISIDTLFLNVGGITEETTFNGVTPDWPFIGGGSFADYFKRHDIPCYYVVQSGADHATWAHLYDREQARIALENTWNAARYTADKNHDSAVNAANKDYDSQTNAANKDYDSDTNTASKDYASAIAQADASYDNAVASANTSYTNETNNAANLLANNALQVAANEDILNQTMLTLSTQLMYDLNKMDNDRAADVAVSASGLQADLEEAAVAQTVNRVNGVVNAVVGVATAVASGVAATAFPKGTVEQGANGIATGLGMVATGITSAITSDQSISVSISNKQNIYDATNNAAQWKLNNTTENANGKFSNERILQEHKNDITNDLANATSENNANLMRTNAANTRDTTIANAGRTRSADYTAATNTRDARITAATNTRDARVTTATNTRDARITTADNTRDAAYNQADLDKDTAQNAIINTRKQQGLEPPYQYGNAESGENAATRPIATWAQVVTQSDAGIKFAGDQFLRYGYQLDSAWDIDDLQVMRYFTYWKLSEVWVKGAQCVIEGAENIICDIMKEGVTVWNDPTAIGKVSIYDNY